MTVSSQIRAAGPYQGDDTTTSFPFAFKVFQASDVLVARVAARIQSILTLSSDYTVTLNADQNTTPGGVVKLLSALPRTSTLTITSNLQLLQPLSLPNGGAFFPRNLEDALDRFVILLQQFGYYAARDDAQAYANIGQALRVPEIDGAAALPAAADRALRLLSFDANGNPVASAPASGSSAELALQLVSASGAGLVGFNPALNYVAATLGRHLADEFWNPCDFPWLAPRTGTGDATASIQACINAAAAAGAGVLIPGGIVFNCNSLSLPSKTHIRGVGQGKSVLRQISGANDLLHLADPGSASAFTSQVTIEDLDLRGTVAADGFQEVLHLMFTQGASDLLIQRVTFTGFRGDGLYIGTGNERGQNPNQVRHNRRVCVRDCLFDGEVKNNRNGISVIDCDGLWIERNTFTRIGRIDMPGCIDLESDSGGTAPTGKTSFWRNVVITGNTFTDNAGAAVIAVNIPNAFGSVDTVPHSLTISDNYIDGGALAYTVGISFNGPATTRGWPPQNIRIERNTIRNVSSPWLIAGVRGVKFEANLIAETRYSGEIGSPTTGAAAFDVEFYRNHFYRVAQGSGGGNAVLMYGSENVSFRFNLFDTCGLPGGYSAGIVMQAGGNNELTVEDNTFYQPAFNVQAFDVRFDGGSYGIFRHNRNKLININGGTANCANNFTPPNDYLTPGLESGWVAFGGNDQAPQFWKDGEGMVHLRGALKNGSSTGGATVLKLPAGFRPGRVLTFTVPSLSGTSWSTGLVQIEQSIGDMQILLMPGNTKLSLDGISFKAEA